MTVRAVVRGRWQVAGTSRYMCSVPRPDAQYSALHDGDLVRRWCAACYSYTYTTGPTRAPSCTSALEAAGLAIAERAAVVADEGPPRCAAS